MRRVDKSPVIVFIFRRDLRTDDNLAYDAALKAADQERATMLPIFIFNNQQTSPDKNDYYSPFAMKFMVESLMEIEGLIAFADLEDIEVLRKIHSTSKVLEVHFNADLSPFALQRDKSIADWCHELEIKCLMNYDDYHLINPLSMEKPYQKFTPFFNRYIDSVIARAKDTEKGGTRRITKKMKTIMKNKTLDKHIVKPAAYFDTRRNHNLQLHSGKIIGGRSYALKILADIDRGKYGNYNISRDEIHNENGTTHLSAYLKFGCISVREVFDKVLEKHGKSHELIRQLFWRAFYDEVMYHFPQVLQGQISSSLSSSKNESLKVKYDAIRWPNTAAYFTAWSTGRTGFPLVDAGIRQLITTGYMHNRLRMITASFLTKVLHVDWRWGEKFFAQHLIDYHPSANSGGWQWASGSGADSQPYIRTFSPWLQAKKFDKDCIYIKRYVEELRGADSKLIHSWHSASANDIQHSNDNKNHIRDYPLPIVNFANELKVTLQLYKVIFV